MKNFLGSKQCILTVYSVVVLHVEGWPGEAQTIPWFHSHTVHFPHSSVEDTDCGAWFLQQQKGSIIRSAYSSNTIILES